MRYACSGCSKSYSRKDRVLLHCNRRDLCRGESWTLRYRCRFCGLGFRFPKKFTAHEPKCGAMRRLRATRARECGFRTRTSVEEKTEKIETSYVCERCGISRRKFDAVFLSFHRCSRSKSTSAYDALCSEIDLDSAAHRRFAKKCFRCGSLFPTDERLFHHYRQRRCKKRRVGSTGKNNVYFKCEACNEYYKFRSTFRRHLRAHAFDRRVMKRLLKTTPSVRGGGGRKNCKRRRRRRRRRRRSSGADRSTKLEGTDFTRKMGMVDP